MTRAKGTTPPEVMRGVAGGALLGVPLLYTQEVWLLGGTLSPFAILVLLAITFALTVALSHYVGFERTRPRFPTKDATVAVGLSMLMAAVLLLLLHRIDFGTHWRIVIGIVTLTSIPISIGFAIGNALAPEEGGEGASRMTGPFGDLLAAAAGTIVLALNIAPTEEPLRIAGELGWLRLSIIVVASLVLPYVIVFYAEFGGREQRRASDGATQTPVVETLLAYLVAFTVCGILLGAFGRLEHLDATNLAEVVVLAFPGSLGGALGRMLV